MIYSLIGLLVLALDIYVIYLVVISHGDPGMKVLWIILVLLLPLIGPILYFVVGPGKRLA